VRCPLQYTADLFSEGLCNGTLKIADPETPDERIVCEKCGATWSDGRKPE